jgi:enoyl-CoA hydratase/carnithine racemase
MSVVVETLAPGVQQIRINRPERMNALGVATVQALREACAEVEAARVVLLRGTGRGFCAGADLKERAGMDAPARVAHNRAINAAADALEALPMPTIGLTEARVGAIPGAGGTQRLPRLIGTARALQMMLAGEPLDAPAAAAWNIVQEVAPDAELDARVLAYAALVASRSPRMSRMLKRVVRTGMEQSLAEALQTERDAVVEVLASADYAEGLSAFAERRAPVFVD